MPIKKTSKGWYWGSKGPFATREKAEQVQRAAYASGYTGDSIKYGEAPSMDDPFTPSNKRERQYIAQLRKVARNVNQILALYNPADPESLPKVERMLRSYSYTLEGYGEAVASKMFDEADRANKQQWRKYANKIGLDANTKKAVLDFDMSQAKRAYTDYNSRLTASLAENALQRLKDIQNGTLYANATAAQREKAIKDSGKIVLNRAALIGRTENARMTGILTRIRAVRAGAEGYIWESHEDDRVRFEHHAQNGKFTRYAKPPELENGMIYHAGEGPNCRCVQRPIFNRGIR